MLQENFCKAHNLICCFYVLRNFAETYKFPQVVPYSCKRVKIVGLSQLVLLLVLLKSA